MLLLTKMAIHPAEFHQEPPQKDNFDTAYYAAYALDDFDHDSEISGFAEEYEAEDEENKMPEVVIDLLGLYTRLFEPEGKIKEPKFGKSGVEEVDGASVFQNVHLGSVEGMEGLIDACEIYLNRARE